jgi:hypothetical protein
LDISDAVEPKKAASKCQGQHLLPTMVHFTPLLFLVLSFLSVSYSSDFSVDVGKAGPSYTPDHVLGVAAGDTITFNFFPPNLTVTQSSFNDPCTKLPGGIDSGLYVLNAVTPDRFA